jgi:hypothetical protein
MSDPRPVNVFFVGEPRTVEAVRVAIAGLERVKHSPPEAIRLCGVDHPRSSLPPLDRKVEGPAPRRHQLFIQAFGARYGPVGVRVEHEEQDWCGAGHG